MKSPQNKEKTIIGDIEQRRRLCLFLYVCKYMKHICKFVKETLLKLKTYLNPYKLIVRDFSAHLSAIDRSYRQKISKEILELRDK